MSIPWNDVAVEISLHGCFLFVSHSFISISLLTERVELLNPVPARKEMVLGVLKLPKPLNQLKMLRWASDSPLYLVFVFIMIFEMVFSFSLGSGWILDNGWLNIYSHQKWVLMRLKVDWEVYYRQKLFCNWRAVCGKNGLKVGQNHYCIIQLLLTSRNNTTFYVFLESLWCSLTFSSNCVEMAMQKISFKFIVFVFRFIWN